MVRPKKRSFIQENIAAKKQKVSEPNILDVERCCKVISGRYNQTSDKFSIESHGNQCTANSCVALVYHSQVKSLFNRDESICEWNSDDFDEILTTGDKLYLISKNEIPQDSNFLLFETTFPYVYLNGHLYFFYGDEEEVNDDNNIKYLRGGGFSLANVMNALTYFHSIQVETALFTGGHYSFAVFLLNGKFCFLDSHSRDSDGLPTPDGFAVLCVHDSIEKLARHLITNCGLNADTTYNDGTTNFILKAVWAKREVATGSQGSFLAIQRKFEKPDRVLNRSMRYELSQALESHEDSVMRKSREAVEKSDRRMNEGIEQYEKRLASQAVRDRLAQKSRTDEQRAKKAKHMQNVRSSETPAKRVVRLQDLRQRKKITTKVQKKTNTTIANADINVLKNAFSMNESLHDLNSRISELNVGRGFEVEKILSVIFHHRSTIFFKFVRNFEILKEKLQAAEVKFKSVDDENQQYSALFGISLHTKHSEAYFASATYNTLEQQQILLAMNTDGEVMNLFNYQQQTTNEWLCNDNICKINKQLVSNIFASFIQSFVNLPSVDILGFFDNVDHCKNAGVHERVSDDSSCLGGADYCEHNFSGDWRKRLIGHPSICYENDDNCDSVLLFLRRMSPHFPFLRQIVRHIYVALRHIREVRRLSDALRMGDMASLEAIFSELQQNSGAFSVSPFPYTNETEIYDQYCHAFETSKKAESDWPIHPCMSCTKLYPKKKLNRVPESLEDRDIFQELLEYHGWETAGSDPNLCTYCLDKFKQNILPPTCVLNGFDFDPVPEYISRLNEMEKLFIQRAKAFQTVYRMDTVMGGHNKQRPNTEAIKKIKGRVFHLPLPLENSLSRLPDDPTEAVLSQQDLIILVRGIPNDKKHMWQSLVSVTKVYDALKWLIENNPIYEDLVLPVNWRDKLFHGVRVNVDQISERFADDECMDDGNQNENENEIEARVQNEKKMLTQKDECDDFYEPMSIYPVIESRLNAMPSKIFQLVKVVDKCIDNYNAQLDLRCFPDLFCRGINGQYERKRKVKIQPAEYAKWVMQTKHKRFRLNLQYLFFLLNQANFRQINAGIFHKLNVTQSIKGMNKATFLNMISNDDEHINKNLSTIFARLRNTKQFWSSRKNDLDCMVEHYGPATWFLTLSPSEYHWEDLHEFLCIRNDIKDKKSRTLNSLIASDPVSVSLFMNMKFKAMLDFLLSKDHPLGEIIHYAWRLEYQSRGLQHFHILLWVRGAPVIGQNTPEEIAAFINKYVTCKLPPKNSFPQLHQRVLKYQTHKHNSYCMRPKTNNDSKTVRVRRFGFPRKPTDDFILHSVAESVYGRRKLTKTRLYELPRSQGEENVNDYNAAVLLRWIGNSDLQFIGEYSAMLTLYIMKYQTKPKKSLANDDFRAIFLNKSVVSALWSVACQALSKRECGALEAADTLLQIPLFGTDRDTVIRWVDVRQERSKKVKSKQQLLEMADDDTNIFCSNMIDDVYPKRHIKLENLNLYDFLRHYDVVSKQPTSEKVTWYPIPESDKYIRKRFKPYLLNHYKINRRTQPDNYYYSLLLLFKPWRDHSELKCGMGNYSEAYLVCKDELEAANRYHDMLEDLKKNREEFEKDYNRILEQMENNEQQQDEMDENILGFEVPLQDELNEMNELARNNNSLSLKEEIDLLNVDQKRIFDEAVNCLTEYRDAYDAADDPTKLQNPRLAPERVLRKLFQV